ncbi:hypothetical protein TRP8649_03956 [Pelagimonas phthalicica]|uniref:Hedgehog/Intein (Hint) domain-containing protein n=1 Tax=Pelagimonas phthalicica TaxID=1037362 RepID=A0A238JI35_9RHOB|nr:Hint domain-containing protein [Pelagimonas phthalicica]TDS89649.1 Hint domain-containing protein [Pelagimonas phthalicica]SMX29817.1 hypothetical protein TRP8649_03956 [Pelagimonas phthalicica]
MPQCHGYSTDGLVYTPRGNSWSLRRGFDRARHRISIRFAELAGEPAFDGYRTDPEGAVLCEDQHVAQGCLSATDHGVLEGPGGEVIFLDRIDVAGAPIGYRASAPLQPGLAYGELEPGGMGRAFGPNGGLDAGLDNGLAENTRIMTDRGEIPVRFLARGDRILTRDNGYQPLRWLGRLSFSCLDLRRVAGVAPVWLGAHPIGPGRENRSLMISPGHRILVEGADVQLLFGEDEVLVEAAHLRGAGTEGHSIPLSNQSFTYHQLLFHRHQIVQANGVWVQSLFVPPPSCAGPKPSCALSPKGIYHARATRSCLTQEQAALLMTLRRRNTRGARKLA